MRLQHVHDHMQVESLGSKRDLELSKNYGIHFEISAWHRVATADMGKPAKGGPSVANSTFNCEEYKG